MTPRRPRPVLLCVEDDSAIRELIATVATACGLEVITARDGAEALALAAVHRPGLITLDLVLPDLDGFALCDRLRALPGLDDATVLVVTALTDAATIRRAYGMGVTDYISKPFNVDLLGAKLRAFLKLRALADELRERERFLVDVLEHLSSGLLVCDGQGLVLRLNAAGASQLGLSDGMVALGRALSDVAPGAEAFLDVGEPGSQLRATVRTPVGERQLGFSATSLEGGGAVVVFRELTVAETARRDAETRQRLEHVARQARAFAHEVRNPATSIGAAAQMIARDDIPVDMRRRLARAIESEMDRVVTMVREYVEMQTPGAPTGTADLAELLAEVLDVNLLGSPARGRVTLDIPGTLLPRVRADIARFKQVVLNLLLNAVTATEKGGTIALTLTATEEPRGVMLTVRDTGHGIATEDLPRIFDEAFSTRPGGAGLGLPIARRIVEEHGGTLQVTSVRGAGTTFTVWLRALL